MELICNLLTVFEKLVYRMGETGRDFVEVSDLVSQISRKNYCILADCDKCFEFEVNSDEVIEGIVDVAKAYQDQVLAMSGELVETLKSYRDILAGFQLLSSRKDMALLGLSNVPIIRRIAARKNKLVELTANGVTQKELDRVISSINQVIPNNIMKC